MPRTASPSALTDHIQNLLDERQKHAVAMQGIDETLAEIGRILGQPVARFKAAKASAATAEVAVAAPTKGRKGRRKRGSYATTAEESVLAFIKEEGNPTTQEIKAHWMSEGRGGSADNELSRLTKKRKLKRIPIPGQRGSRYTLA
jgi:hypothetical protein